MKTSLSFASLLLGSLLCAAPAASHATHYALCVGINKYSLSGCSTLSGCVNDATYFRNNLVERGDWQTSDTTLLTNSGAKKSAIRNAITGYAAKAVAGDTFVYQHSSHGGQYSGTSVCLCAYDAEYKDTDLASDLAQFPAGVKVVVIVDACHSGGLFKSREAAKAAAASFDLAGRVSAAIDAIRADEAARGVKAAKLSTNEIGWVTAAEYNESSLDGGYYDSDNWLTNGQDGNVMGGVFLGAFTWAWWNGSCDTKSGTGDNDGYADAYECWDVARACCTSSSLWGSDAFTPQYLNENVLRSVELGWVGDEEPSGVRFAPIPEQTATVGVPLSYTLVATNSTGTTGSIAYSVVSATAPANTYSLSGSTFTFTPAADGAFSFTFLATNATAGACSRATMSVTASLAAPEGLDNSGITASSFTAIWNAVPGAASYELDVASTAFGSRAAGDNVLLEEDFAGFEGTAADRSSSLDSYLAGTGWTGSKVFENGGSAKLGSGSYAGWIATPELDLSSGGTVSFDLTQYGTSGDGNTVSVSIVSGGDETSIGTVTPGATETVSFTIPAASAAMSVKIATSAKRAIIDNLVITGGSSADILAGQSVSGTSFTVSDLIAGTYYWRVRAVGNAKGPYSETQEVTLMADPSAPPSIRPIDDIAVTVGETVDLAVHASAPAEAPITSLTLTEGDDIATLSADGAFSFTPAAPGTYSFTITAINTNGPAEEGFTVTATLAEPTAPEATSVGHNSFTASWTAVPGATAYELVVFEGTGSGNSSGDSGDSGDSGNTFTLVTSSASLTAGDYVILAAGTDCAMNNSCSGSTSGYLSPTDVIVDGTSIVNEDDTLVWTLAGTAASCTLFNADAGKFVNPATSKSIGWSADASGAWKLSLNEGIVTAANADNTSWMLQYNSGSPRFTCYNSAQKKLRFFRRDGSRALSRAVGDIVFSNNVSAVTSYAVTGLQSETEYTFAIRAIAGGEATEWSAPASVTTTAAPAAPAWSEIPAMTASVGFPFRFDLAPYVSGVPTPTLTLTSGSGTLTGSFLEFTPASAGSTTFTVSAANGVGNAASTTFTVTAAVHEPVQYAVCVGINEYEQISSLAGCVNDAQVMASNLVERGGWASTNVTLLTDSQATKAAIRAAITNAAANALAGDTFVYQHSSHGGQFNATEDDEDPLTGEDGKDTFLCVYDEDYYDNTTAYNDYEIAADLAAFPAGVKVVVIVDACHSGGLFKSKAAAKAAAASFDLAGRVTALMDADRARRRARGEDVARTLSSSEIGWATAAEYYEYSYDGGFYHTDEWLTNNVYGDEYWVGSDEDGYYNYPSSYKQGGVFLSSATWNWWNGDADSDAEAGDNDGLCDAYEFWKKGYDFCSVIGEFWYDDSGYNYFPQCANIDVLKSVELGWVVDPRPAAPADPAATGATSSSFTATWTAVPNAVSYLLHVQKKVEDNTRDADGATLLSESFEDGEIPDGWTASSGVGIASGKAGDGTYCVKFTASGASLVTPALENPDSVSFQYKRSSNTASWFLDVFVGPSADGPWTSVGTVSDAGTAWQTFSAPISASGTAYLKFTDARSTGTAERYIDLVVVTGSTGTWEDLAGYAPKSVVGTSQEVTGLDASTDYRFSVRSVDANGLEGVESERTVVHTADADSAPIISVPQISYSATVGGDYVEFTVTATGSPAPTIDATCTEGAYYVFENGEFLFDPDTVGTYHFVFTASNSEGSDTATVTVTVEAAPVTVPTLTISDVSNSGAFASWTACTDVASYTLQLASDDQFTTGGSGGDESIELVNEGFDGGTTLPDGWTVESGAIGGTYTSGGNFGVSSPSLQFKSSVTLSTPPLTNPADISFWYKGNGSSFTSTFVVEQFVSGSWTEVDTVEIAASAATFTHALDPAATQVRFVFTKNSGNVAFDDVVINGTSGSSGSSGGSLILETTVAGTDYTFTGLDPETTYYARVKGDSDWSNVAVFTTSSGTGVADSAPVWSAIPEQTVTLGGTLELDLTPYVSGSPVPVIVPDDSEGYIPTSMMVDSTFVFEPDAVGTYAFTFIATNTEGSDTATVTVTVTAAQPTSLSAPTLLPASDITTNSFTINWEAVDNADGYLLDVVAGDSTALPARAARDATGTWTLVTDVADLVVGDQVIIACTTHDLALSTTQNGNNRGQAAITRSGNLLETPGDAVAVLTLGEGTVANSWSFYDANSNGYLYAASSSSNHLRTMSELNGNGSWAITITDGATGAATVIAQGSNTHNSLRHNNGSSCFSAYASGQDAVCLYRLEGGSAGGASLPTDLAVTGTSYTLTGLDPSTTYTYQLRATSSVYGLTSPVSAPGSATTLGTAPAWSADFPATGTVDVGELYELADIASYVTGSPAPVITFTAPDGVLAEIDNGNFQFIPEASGDYTFTFTAANGTSPDATATLVVTAVGQAPVLTASQGTSIAAVVGDDVEFTVTATGIPAPTVAMAATEYDAIFENGEFAFAPDAVGTYSFTFTASNTEGTDTLTVTVTVSPAPVTVPTLTVPSVSSSAALAVWTACDGVSSYTVQLATNDQFAAESSGGSLQEDFTGFTSANSYFTSLNTQNVASGTWSYENVIWSPSGAQNGAGSTGYAQLKASVGHLYLPSVDNPVSLSVTARASSGSLKLQQQTDGNNWTDLKTWTLNRTAAVYTYTFDNAEGTTALRFVAGSNATYIHDVEISLPSAPASLLLQETVSDTSYRFTGLETGTQYYVRVKGDDDWSNVVTVTPIDNGVATYVPYWFPLPATNVTVGTEIELDLANYVYSYPDHILTLSTAVDSSLYEFEDGLLRFQPDAVGSYAFTFTAVNAEGSSSATFTVTVTPVPATDFVSALGFDSATITAEQIACRITSFAVGADDSVSGTFAVTAEDEGTPIAESSSLSDAVQLVVLGAAELGDFAPLDATQCGVSLTSRTAPFAFRVERPGTNRFFQVRLAVGEAGE